MVVSPTSRPVGLAEAVRTSQVLADTVPLAASMSFDEGPPLFPHQSSDAVIVAAVPEVGL
jgi:hypothetical protein